MIGYKLFRVRKNGTLGSLFVDRRAVLVPGTTYEAVAHRPKGLAYRPGWHICEAPYAPHLSTRGRRWYKVSFTEYTAHKRPVSQGGKWFVARKLRILQPV